MTTPVSVDRLNAYLGALVHRIDLEREAQDPDGYLLGLQEAYRMAYERRGQPGEPSRWRHPSSGPTSPVIEPLSGAQRERQAPGQTVLSGAYASGQVIDDGIPAVIRAMIDAAATGRDVRVRVEEVFGS